MTEDRLDVDGAIGYARDRLATELDDWLTYHGLHHTADEVVPSARWIAEREGIDGRSLDLLVTGAWFHDLGFVERYDHNEPIAAAIAGDVLPGFGFRPDDVDTVVGVIEATEVPQRPTTLIEEVMCDADLFLLGTDRFEEREHALRAELAHLGRAQTDAEWAESQIAFLTTHRYFTDSARQANDATKAANLAMVRRRLARSDA